MEGYSQTYNADGTESSRSHEEAKNEQKAPSVNPAAHDGNVRYRAQVNPETGEVEVTSSVAKGANVSTAAPADAGSAMDQQGNRVPLWQAGPKDIVDLPGLGNSSAEAWVQMGYLRPLKDGGYEMIGSAPLAPGTPPAPPAAAAPPSAPKPDDSAQPADAHNVPGTTESADRFQKSLEARPGMYEEIITTIARGKAPDFAEIARTAGESEETFVAQSEALHGELIASGQAVLRNVGCDAPEAFEAWALANRPEQANDAVRAMMGRDASKLAALGREFVRIRANEIATEATARGVDAKVENGVIYFRRESLGLSKYAGGGDFRTEWISEKDARANGSLEINE